MSGTLTGGKAIPQSQSLDPAELLLLFVTGKRPDRTALQAAATLQTAYSISEVPNPDGVLHNNVMWAGQQDWVELLTNGLAFDLSGLAPGPASMVPLAEHRFDLTEMPTLGEFEALTLQPGPHLAAAGRSMPVMKAMLALACNMTRQFDDLAAVYWVPSRSIIGARYFESVVTAWIEGGPFPALGLTAFVEAPSGELASVGLDIWIGQELRIEPPLTSDTVFATQLGIRILNHLVTAGGITAPDHLIAPDGSRLALEPSPDGRLIRVRRE